MADRSEKRDRRGLALTLAIIGLSWSILGGWDPAIDKLKEVSTVFYVVAWFLALGAFLFAAIWLLFIGVNRVRRSINARREERELAAERMTSRYLKYTESVNLWVNGFKASDPVEAAHETRTHVEELVKAGLLPHYPQDLMDNRSLLRHYAAEARALLLTYGYEEAAAMLTRRRAEEGRQQFEAVQESRGAT